MGKAPLSRPLREIKQLLCVHSLILYYIKQIDSMLPCICPVIDHRGRQNVVRTSVKHSAIASCATFLFLPHFDVICDLLLDRCTATWNLFVNLTVHFIHNPSFGGEPWSGTLCCVHGQDTLLSQCLSPPRHTNGYWRT